jgi:hypothetical protein
MKPASKAFRCRKAFRFAPDPSWGREPISCKAAEAPGRLTTIYDRMLGGTCIGSASIATPGRDTRLLAVEKPAPP